MEALRYKKSINPTSTEEPQQSAKKKLNTWLISLLIVSLGAVMANWYISQASNPTIEPEPITKLTPIAVTALGRLEPKGEVIKLSVANAQDSRVNELLVEEGDFVQAKQLIATLQGLDQKQAELAEAKQNVRVYRAKLKQIQAGEAKVAEIAAQKANIARLMAKLRTESIERKAEIADAQAELKNAEINHNRYQALYKDGAVSLSSLDDRQELYKRSQARLDLAQAKLQNTVATLREQITQEQAVLDKLQEVRPVDLAESQAELDYAIAQVQRIESELEDYYVRVPIDGQILKINTLVGEQVDTREGIVELGRTSQMYAIAEVYETDVSKVKVGQRATVISEHGGFEGTLQGTVDHIGLQIKKQDVLESDPTADKDARVVEVKVHLDSQDSNKVAGLTNLQVRVRIDLL
ncbi:ABC exporter membrane fusion protein, DevB family [Xenococcus sp. PCC 7305]|uniref:ABC exporter membrane fusion protein n=1 Tax=Xenococcus sp. PCC 7305 TaxID=102125 RepID=UPI0002AC2EB1|nr:ABC exporter membrane fusion protein [Xenococcus sp. PCC 7305]ELS00789.1 ABC exporter membrane fusion protein, DevB family [Xenococcus sp. PCC 7305]